MQDAIGGVGYHKDTAEKISGESLLAKTSLEGIVKGGQISVVEDELPDIAYRAFAELAENRSALAIVRSKPLAFKRDYGLDVPVYWLCKLMGVDMSINPDNFIFRSMSYLTDFIGKNPKGVVLIEGLEYLSTQANFSHILKWYQLLSEKVSSNNKLRAIITYDPRALGEKETHLLRKESVNITQEIRNYFENLKK